MRTRLARALIAVMACALMAVAIGCGGSSSDEGGGDNSWIKKSAKDPRALAGTTIRVITVDVSPTTTLKQVVSDFTDKTGIKVKFETYDEPTVRQKMLLDYTSGSATYDVDTVEWWFTPEFASGKHLVPIGDLIKQGTVKGWLDLDDFPGKVLDGFTYEDQLYATPYWLIGGMYYYRTDILKKLGMEPPKDLAGIMDVAAKTKSGGLGYGWAGRGNRDYDAFGSLAGFAAGYGVKLLDENGQPTLTTDPRWKQAMGDWLKLMRTDAPPGAGNSTWYEAYQAFQQGKVSQFFDTSDYGPAFEDAKQSKVRGKSGYLSAPMGPAGKRMEWFYSEGFGVNKDASPKQQAAAWLFLQWRSSPETFAKELVVADSPRFDQPSVKVLDSPEYPAAAKKAGTVAYAAGLREALKVADPWYWPSIPAFAPVAEAVAKDVSAALSSNQSVDEVLKKAQGDVEDALAGRS
jgi:ABC-type glycerol-3-phosphate transport system substrate-binding protein